MDRDVAPGGADDIVREDLEAPAEAPFRDERLDLGEAGTELEGVMRGIPVERDDLPQRALERVVRFGRGVTCRGRSPGRRLALPSSSGCAS